LYIVILWELFIMSNTKSFLLEYIQNELELIMEEEQLDLFRQRRMRASDFSKATKDAADAEKARRAAAMADLETRRTYRAGLAKSADAVAALQDENVKKFEKRAIEAALDLEIDETIKKMTPRAQRVLNKARKGSKPALKKVAGFFKKKISQKLALIATGTAIGGPLGTVIGVISTGMDVKDAVELVNEYLKGHVGGISQMERKLPGRSQAEIGDDILAAMKKLENHEKIGPKSWNRNDRRVAAMGSWKKVKANYEKTIQDLNKERSAPQVRARNKARLNAFVDIQNSYSTSSRKAPDFATAAGLNAPSADQMLGTKPQGINLDTAVAGGPGVAAAIAARGASGDQAAAGTTNRKVSRVPRKAAIQKRLSRDISFGVSDIQKALRGYFQPGSKTFGSIKEQVAEGPDGKYGSETEQAIMDFQSDLALYDLLEPDDIDGLFGPKTLKAYRKVMNDPGLLQKFTGLRKGLAKKPAADKSSGPEMSLTKAAKKVADAAEKQAEEEDDEDQSADQALATAEEAEEAAEYIKQLTGPKGIAVARALSYWSAGGRRVGGSEARKAVIKYATAFANNWVISFKDGTGGSNKDIVNKTATLQSMLNNESSKFYKTIDQIAKQIRDNQRRSESKTYNYLEKLINEELDKILG